jgi:hypothetical protein
MDGHKHPPTHHPITYLSSTAASVIPPPSLFILHPSEETSPDPGHGAAYF